MGKLLCDICGREFSDRYGLANHARNEFKCQTLVNIKKVKKCKNLQNNLKCTKYYTNPKSESCKSCSSKRSNTGALRKGKTFDDIFGKDKANEIKQKQKKSLKKFYLDNPGICAGKNNSNYGKSNPNKGKTWEEIYGVEKASELKNKQSKKSKKLGCFRGIDQSGKNNAYLKYILKRDNITYEEYLNNKGEKAKQKAHIRSIITIISNCIQGREKGGKTYVEYYGVEKAKLIKRKMRQSAIKRLEKNHGQLMPNYNLDGCRLLDEIMKKNNIFIQHAENGGELYIKELGYWVDGYDKENNIVYEIDERAHFNLDGNLKEKDIRRQKEIEDYLGCKFIRIKYEDTK